MSRAQVRLRDAEDLGAELASLHEWLSREQEFRGRVQREAPDAQAGEMGGLTDVLMVALGSGGAMTVLLQSLSTWLNARRPELSVELIRPDGTAVTVHASGSVAAKVVDALDDPPD